MACPQCPPRPKTNKKLSQDVISNAAPGRRRVTGKSAPQLAVTQHGNLLVEAIAQKGGNITPADWAKVTTSFKNKELQKRLKRAENKEKQQGQGKAQGESKKGAKRTNPKAKAKAKAKAKPSPNEPIPWQIVLKRQHSNVYHRERLRGQNELGLSKQDAQAGAGEVARAHLARLRKLRSEGDFKSMPKFGYKVDFGDED